MAAKKKAEAEPTEEQSPEYTRNEILNKAKEIRLDHHTSKGIDQEDMKAWSDLSGDKQGRWVREAEEALGLKMPDDD